MFVDESLDHLQITTGTLKGERSVASLIHCNWEYKQIVDSFFLPEINSIHILGHLRKILVKPVGFT